jgi:hypothetical protein
MKDTIPKILEFMVPPEALGKIIGPKVSIERLLIRKIIVHTCVYIIIICVDTLVWIFTYKYIFIYLNTHYVYMYIYVGQDCSNHD